MRLSHTAHAVSFRAMGLGRASRDAVRAVEGSNYSHAKKVRFKKQAALNSCFTFQMLSTLSV